MVARLGVRLELFFLPGRLKEEIEAHLVTGLEMLLDRLLRLRGPISIGLPTHTHQKFQAKEIQSLGRS